MPNHRDDNLTARSTDRLVLGTAQLCTDYGVMGDTAGRSETEATMILELASGAGIGTLDTAPSYGDAEAFIGRTDTAFRIHTKLVPGMRPEQSIAGSLQRLCRDHVDVAYLHDPDAVTTPGNPDLTEAAALVGGPIRKLGASIYSAAQAEAALGTDAITVLQAPVNVLTGQALLSQLETAARCGVEVYGRSAFLQGALLAGDGLLPPAVEHLVEYLDPVRTLSLRHDLPLAAVALGWVLHFPFLAGVVIGAASATQLSLLLAALPCLPLPDPLIDDLMDVPRPDESAIDPRLWSAT